MSSGWIPLTPRACSRCEATLVNHRGEPVPGAGAAIDRHRERGLGAAPVLLLLVEAFDLRDRHQKGRVAVQELQQRRRRPFCFRRDPLGRPDRTGVLGRGNPRRPRRAHRTIVRSRAYEPGRDGCRISPEWSGPSTARVRLRLAQSWSARSVAWTTTTRRRISSDGKSFEIVDVPAGEYYLQVSGEPPRPGGRSVSLTKSPIEPFSLKSGEVKRIDID